ncbi:MAG: GNAT family N-acetyltransferase [Clostridia bacterium]|nr:GNAT family N-acetyltransferase [Clostridia bacterium]
MYWKFHRFHELDPKTLYEILKLRVNVFIIEQNCFYHELDDKDYYATHMCGYDGENRLIAYLRILDPGISFDEVSIGRVVVAPEVRGDGIGRKLMLDALEYAKEAYDSPVIRISAQAYLQDFYESVGFVPASEIYLEDDIPHMDMLFEKFDV